MRTIMHHHLMGDCLMLSNRGSLLYVELSFNSGKKFLKHLNPVTRSVPIMNYLILVAYS